MSNATCNSTLEGREKEGEEGGGEGGWIAREGGMQGWWDGWGGEVLDPLPGKGGTTPSSYFDTQVNLGAATLEYRACTYYNGIRVKE
jgi:hypothetical protein